MPSSKTVVLSEGALCIALSVVLSFLAVFHMPQGGSLTLELVPLVIFAWRRGVRWGCGAGALTGLLHIFFGGYVVHPLQALLEYPTAYAVIGLSGLWRSHVKKPSKSIGLLAGLAVGGIAQLTCHFAAGVVFFSSYAPEGMNVWLYSAVYNGTIVLPKIVITAIVSWLLWRKLENLELP